MSHLVCEKCGGYYKLKEGESPEDFKACQCGGDLKYVQNFGSHFDVETDPLTKLNICSNHDSNFIKEHSAKEIIVRILAVITGILIVLMPQLLIFNENYALPLIVIGGLVSSIVVKNNNGITNAAIVGLVAGLILLILRSNITFSSEISYFDVFTLEMIGSLLILTIFGVFGGLINIFMRFLILKYKKGS